ncbi:hypothetical protein [Arthrobacter methylotrophus]|uniref:Uncharacterized protein n=1 Tax=Arthrobacter methylotrophus TaxID=121291 RepID=A0ABV5UNS1_9MICC
MPGQSRISPSRDGSDLGHVRVSELLLADDVAVSGGVAVLVDAGGQVAAGVAVLFLAPGSGDSDRALDRRLEGADLPRCAVGPLRALRGVFLAELLIVDGVLLAAGVRDDPLASGNDSLRFDSPVSEDGGKALGPVGVAGGDDGVLLYDGAAAKSASKSLRSSLSGAGASVIEGSWWMWAANWPSSWRTTRDSLN